MTRSGGNCTPHVVRELGKKGQEVLVLMSQISVVVVPSRGTAESWSEGNGCGFPFLSSGSLC